jgi:hypothetical protein
VGRGASMKEASTRLHRLPVVSELARRHSERTPAVSIVGRRSPTVCHGRVYSASASLPEALLEAGDAHATGGSNVRDCRPGAVL